MSPARHTAILAALAAGFLGGAAGTWWLVSGGAVAAVVLPRLSAASRVTAVLAVAGLAVLGGGLHRAARASLVAAPSGPVRGLVRIDEDPRPLTAARSATRLTELVVEIGGARYRGIVAGMPARRLERAQAGDRLWIDAERRPARRGDRRGATDRIGGRLTIRALGDRFPGSALDRSVNRVRLVVRDQADAAMGGSDGALFSGLVLGDDARQPPAMVAEFRGSGLSHLTAVSGQNITILVAFAGPLLRRLRPLARLAATLALIAWLVVLTRGEPSVVRAALMGALAAISFALGRPTLPLDALIGAVVLAVAADPLLVRSVGLWLSAGATAGVIVLGPPIAGLLWGPGWIRAGLGMTIGAQLGVAVPSVLVFGRLPLVAIPANLLAVPVAAFVMAAGVPLALLAAAAPAVRAWVMAPATIGTRWVGRVASLAARLEPPPPVAWAGWLLIAALLARAALHRSRPVTPPGGDTAR